MHLSSLDRLRELPDVLTLKTVAAVFGWETKVASHYIARWKKKGFVSSLGERTGVHFNLLKNPKAAEENFVEALKFLFPGAVICGASALHMSGTTTQIPSQIEIAIPWRPTFPRVEGAEISTRSAPWFRLVRDRLVWEATLPRLAPEMALADDWMQAGWRPDPDDIDWDMVDAKVLAADFARLGGDIPEIWRAALAGEEDRPGW